MNENQSSVETASQNRQDLIETAVRFLNNPKVIPTPLESKRLFLSKKGLTESEIQAALQKSSTNVPIQISTDKQLVEVETKPVTVKQTIWQKLFSLAKNLILTGCVTFIGYKLLIKKFLKKKSKLEKLKTKNEELKNSIDEIKSSITQLKDSIETMNTNLTKLSVQKVDDSSLKTEMQSIKNLLLSRQQFPSIPTVNPIIPSWQLETKSSPNKDKETLNDTTESKESPIIKDRESLNLTFESKSDDFSE